MFQQALGLIADEPPAPWHNRVVISAAGVFAAGWDNNNNVVLVSHDGYSVSNSVTGERLKRNRDSEAAYDALSDDYLRFKMPHNKETVPIFGLNGGDGTHVTKDGWVLKAIYPDWPNAVILIRSPFVSGTGLHGYLDRAHSISLIRLENSADDLRCGFSPSGRFFMITASAGAEVFSR